MRGPGYAWYPREVDAGEIVLRLGDNKLVCIRIDRAETCIGPDISNDVVVPDERLAKVAASLIAFGAGRYKLRNMSPGLVKVRTAVKELIVVGDEMDIDLGTDVIVGKYTLHLQERTPDPPPPHIPGSKATEHLRVIPRGATGAVLYSGEQEFVLHADRPFNVGTDPDCDLVTTDTFMSNFHARISLVDKRWIMADLNSTNGTTVNGLWVREAELPPYAELVFGRTTARFELQGQRPAFRDDGVALYGGMVARSASMQAVFNQTQKLSLVSAAVLVRGPSGSGKELVARAIHDMGPRSARPYLPLNCGALHASLIESELFGHERGAFTGADSQKKGAFEATQGGTLFLDEIGELPLDLQPKLLRVLETSTIRRVGGTTEVPVDVRIVAATHRNLHDLVLSGRFREDLFHRLYVLSLEIPPLCDRTDDILPLARHFLDSQRQLGRGPFVLTREAELKLLAHDWPGNVRELRNAVLRAVLMSERPTIDHDDLVLSAHSFQANAGATMAQLSVRQADQEERARVLEILDKVGHNRAEAARILGVSKSTFHDRLKRLGIPTKTDLTRLAR